jgi:nucleotide-binding universal stress UspA family protein
LRRLFVAPRIPAEGIMSETVIVVERPVLVAVDFEEASRRALLTAQTIGRGLGAPIALLGSVAEQVVRRSRIPVLTVRVPR